MASITESVEEPLVRIGGVFDSDLCQGVVNRIDDLERYRNKRKHVGLSEGERRAIEEGVGLEVSWAAIKDDNARLVRNALLQAYLDCHGHLPGYVSKTTGVRVPGHIQLEKKSTTAVDLNWSPWRPAVEETKAHLLQGEMRGVYRIRAV